MRIDTANIEGFEGMTADQKVEALLGLEFQDPVDMTKYVKKDVLDKKASEAAELSRRLKEKMTADEQAEAERQENQTALQKSLEEANATIQQLQREREVSRLTASYLAQGYEKDLAAKAAEALIDGKTEVVMECATKHMAAHDKALRAELMKNTPVPPGADGSGKEVPENVAMAAKLGKAKAEASKSTNSVLAAYLKK